MPFELLVPASLAFDGAGTPVSERFGDVYHSADGGLAQARHVFLAGNGLPARWGGLERFAILETGFGLGLNFLATWAAWRADPARPRSLHFVSVEKFPFDAASLERLHRAWPPLADLSEQLHRSWPPLTPGFHRIHFDDGALTLTLLFGDAIRVLRDFDGRIDAFFLDGFAPDRNPAMWSGNIANALARVAAEGATLATWTVAGTVRDGLARAGFMTDKRPGFGRKREMLAGRFRGRVRTGPLPAGERRAVVIGAGLAGAAVTERLAARGWDVSLVERHAGAAREASGNHAGVLRPMLSRDDNIASRLSRAAFLYALRRLGDLGATGMPPAWDSCGVLQVARTPDHSILQRQTVATLAFPESFVRHVESDEAGHLVGRPVAASGWWFPRGAWVSPPELARALVARHRDQVRALWTHQAFSLRHEGGQWQILAANGACFEEAPVVVLANAYDAQRLFPAAAFPLKRVRGQVTHLPADNLSGLRCVVCRDGYVTPPLHGICCVGASFEHDDDPLLRVSSHAGNLMRLTSLLPGTDIRFDAASLDGRVAFRTATPDRLPLAGPVPDLAGALAPQTRLFGIPRHAGLYAIVGLGARGLAWAPLLGEFIAARINGEPLPIERDLATALDPARFALRLHRRGNRAKP